MPDVANLALERARRSNDAMKVSAVELLSMALADAKDAEGHGAPIARLVIVAQFETDDPGSVLCYRSNCSAIEEIGLLEIGKLRKVAAVA